MLIFLIGYMGSGKTSIGKKLARKLGYTFIDLDEYIEKQAHKSISEIFSQYGEEYFRKIEAKHLKTIAQDQKNCIISTGGGAPCFHNNMELMGSAGYSIYLKLSPKSLQFRLASSKSKRPLITGKTDKELLDFIVTHLQEREEFYNKAHIIIKGEDLTPQKLYELIANKLIP